MDVTEWKTETWDIQILHRSESYLSIACISPAEETSYQEYNFFNEQASGISHFLRTADKPGRISDTFGILTPYNDITCPRKPSGGYEHITYRIRFDMK